MRKANLHKRPFRTYKQMMRDMKWPYPETGSPGALKIIGKTMPVDGHLRKGGGNIEDATLPYWKIKKIQKMGKPTKK